MCVRKLPPERVTGTAPAAHLHLEMVLVPPATLGKLIMCGTLGRVFQKLLGLSGELLTLG